MLCRRPLFNPSRKPSFRPKRRTVSPSAAQWRNLLLLPMPGEPGQVRLMVIRHYGQHQAVAFGLSALQPSRKPSFRPKRRTASPSAAQWRNLLLLPMPCEPGQVRLIVIRRYGQHQAVAFGLSLSVLQPIQETVISTEAADSLTVRRAVEKSASLTHAPTSQVSCD